MLVGQPRQARQVLANVDARNIRANRPELAADFLGGAGLEIERVQMAWPAVGPEEDDGEIAIDVAAFLSVQHLSETRRHAGAKGAETQAADFEPGAAIEWASAW